MIDDELLAVLEATLSPLGFLTEDGEEFRDPPLDVLRYYRRPVQLHWLPLLGQSQAVVAVVRQPVDLAGTEAGCRQLLDRLAPRGQHPLPPELGPRLRQHRPDHRRPDPRADQRRRRRHARRRPEGDLRSRVVPLALVRLNLGQEAMSFQLAGGPDGLFPEPVALVDALTGKFRRFVPTLEWD